METASASGSTAANSDLYSKLNCSPSASTEEIKSSYHELILKHHPDKNLPNSKKFIEINEAWQTLRDSEKRKVYDAELLQKQFSEHPLVYDCLNRNDCQFDPDSGLYQYSCRCGGLFLIEKENLEHECFVPCDECSLVVQIKVK